MSKDPTAVLSVAQGLKEVPAQLSTYEGPGSTWLLPWFAVFLLGPGFQPLSLQRVGSKCSSTLLSAVGAATLCHVLQILNEI